MTLKKATIYHNPNCSKSRQALQILHDHNLEIEEVRYLETPPSIEKLESLCHSMAIEPQYLLRTGESVFKELGLDINEFKPRHEWLEIMINHPILIERPIVKIGNQVVMGRPPEKVLTILE